MGTHALTRFEQSGGYIGAFYRHYDGYPMVHGAELKAIVEEAAPKANGMSCLGATVIAKLKTEPSGIYLAQPDDAEEWTYTLSSPSGRMDDIYLVVEHRYSRQTVRYSGPMSGFDPEAVESRTVLTLDD